ncbi:MAG: lipopolysaccharide biosynthesis protein [Promethearchaeota archaeon]
MEIGNTNKNSSNIEDEFKNLAKNSFYSLLNQYGTIFFLIISSFFIARLISQELWGLLILANSYIMIVAIITFFIPPALEYSIIYYLPRYSLLNQQTKLKSFIKKGLVIKSIVISAVFLINILLSQFIVELFNIDQKIQLILLIYLISPLVFVLGFQPIFNSINQGLNNFKIVFILFIIKAIINISSLIYVILFIKNVQIELIALIYLISEVVPFILNCILILIKVLKIEDTEEKGLTYKKIYQMTIKYGLPISYNYLEYTLWNEIQIQGIGLLNQPQYITGYNISLSYSNVAKNASSALHTPLTTSFSRLNVTEDLRSHISVYNLIIKYSLFLLLLFSGLMFFITNFYLEVIYGVSYLNFTNFLKIMVISIIFRVLITPFDSILYAQNRTKLLPPIRLIMLLIQVSIFFIGLIGFGIIGAVFGILIINILLFLLFLFLNLKILKVKIELKTIFLQYLAFSISILLTLLLDFLIYKNLYSSFIQFLNLSFFQYFPLFSIITFFLIFFIFNVVFKTFSSKDIEILDSFLNKENRLIRYFRKKFKFIMKIIRLFE